MEFLLNYKKLLLFIIFPLLTANLSGERIAKIDVHGNKTTDEELIKSSSMLQVGDEITQRKLDNAIT